MPFDGARVVNVARRAHPTLDSVQADLAEPADWDVIAEHLAEELAEFTGSRAIFVHNAFLSDPVGFIGEIDPVAYRRHVLANVAAPVVLGEAFLRNVPDGVEAGLVMISSAAARVPFAGRAGYGAGKAAIEQWVNVVRSELEHRGSTNWVVAIRPGAVDTPSFRADAEADPTVLGARAPEVAALVHRERESQKAERWWPPSTAM